MLERMVKRLTLREVYCMTGSARVVPRSPARMRTLTMVKECMSKDCQRRQTNFRYDVGVSLFVMF